MKSVTKEARINKAIRESVSEELRASTSSTSFYDNQSPIITDMEHPDEAGLNLVQHGVLEMYKKGSLLLESLKEGNAASPGLSVSFSITPLWTRRKRVLLLFDDLSSAWQNLVCFIFF
jgi:hypothetical protein